MPSPVGHAIAGVAAGWLVAGAPRRGLGASTRRRDAAIFGGLALLPDVDLLFGAHSGPTHSVGAAALVAFAAWFLAGRLAPHLRPWVFACACGLAYGSHVLLDWLSTDSSPPIGIMALWPFDRTHYESSLHVFMAISRRYYHGWAFVGQNVRALARELAILLPILGGILWLRSRGPARRRS